MQCQPVNATGRAIRKILAAGYLCSASMDRMPYLYGSDVNRWVYRKKLGIMTKSAFHNRSAAGRWLKQMSAQPSVRNA